MKYSCKKEGVLFLFFLYFHMFLLVNILLSFSKDEDMVKSFSIITFRYLSLLCPPSTLACIVSKVKIFELKIWNMITRFLHLHLKSRSSSPLPAFSVCWPKQKKSTSIFSIETRRACYSMWNWNFLILYVILACFFFCFLALFTFLYFRSTMSLMWI